MSLNKINQTPDSIKEDTALGRVRYTGVYVGIVKGNSDPQRMGRLSVYIPELGGNPEDEATWYVMSYGSPFAGASNLDNNTKDGEQAKKMAGTQTSYGWWAVPPDINNEVVCCFVNGDTSRGIWFGCLYQQFMNHMVPAVGLNLSTDDEINKKNLPPVAEYNRKDSSQNIWDPKRPPYEPLHDALVKQGLYTDPERGPATTGARRESPSKVFGLLTPRGNTIHVDDDETNEFIRFRTRSGVQLLIHETTGYIYMISKEGNSWFELSDEGINMYTKRSISMRAEENINIHADKGSYSHAAGGAHTRTGNHTAAHESDSNTETTGDRTTKTDGTDQKDAAQVKRNSDKMADEKKTATSGGSGPQPRNDGTKAMNPSTPGDPAPNGTSSQPGGSSSYRNNNPGNLMLNDYTRGLGADGGDVNGSTQAAHFPDYAAGRAAQEKALFEGKWRDQSFDQMIYQYAPAGHGDNDPTQYRNEISARTGLDMSMPLGQYSTEQRGQLMSAMQNKEGWLGPRR